MNWRNLIRKLNFWSARMPNFQDSVSSSDRLARSFACLLDIQLVRDHWHNQALLKAAEERLIWRELLELELQELDEQIERLTAVVGESGDH